MYPGIKCRRSDSRSSQPDQVHKELMQRRVRMGHCHIQIDLPVNVNADVVSPVIVDVDVQSVRVAGPVPSPTSSAVMTKGAADAIRGVARSTAIAVSARKVFNVVLFQVCAALITRRWYLSKVHTGEPPENAGH